MDGLREAESDGYRTFPYQLELVDGHALVEWLRSLRKR